jgi:hypothetical protein
MLESMNYEHWHGLSAQESHALFIYEAWPGSLESHALSQVALNISLPLLNKVGPNTSQNHQCNSSSKQTADGPQKDQLQVYLQRATSQAMHL